LAGADAVACWRRWSVRLLRLCGDGRVAPDRVLLTAMAVPGVAVVRRLASER
jgi:hypothetical protein